MMHVDFEIGPRAEFTDSFVRSAAKYFGLAGVTEYRALGGAFNLNVLVHTSSGAFVIRVYRPWVTPERLDFLHVMKKALLETGLPIPQPIAWVKGSQLGVHTDRLIEVERYIKNDGVADTWRRHEVAFSMLGRLHDALAKTVTASQFVPPKVHNYALPKEMLKWIEQTQFLIRQSGLGASAEAMRALQLCDEAKELLAIIQDCSLRSPTTSSYGSLRSPTPSAYGWVDTGYRLPKQLVHGDYGGANVVFNNEHIVAVLDFDLVDIHERVFDLAYSLYFAMGSLEYDKPLPERPWHRVTQVVEAYNQSTENPLSAMEWEALPIEMARVPLYWVAEAGFTPNPVGSLLDEADGIQQSRWMLSHLSNLLRHRGCTW